MDVLCKYFLILQSCTSSIYLKINLHYVRVSTYKSIHGELSVFYPQYLHIFLYWSTVPVNSVIFCVYLSTDLSHCIYKVSIFLQCWSIYLSLSMSVYRQFKSFFLCLNTDTVFDYILNKWRQCLSIYIVYLPKLLIYLNCTYFYSIV